MTVYIYFVDLAGSSLRLVTAADFVLKESESANNTINNETIHRVGDMNLLIVQGNFCS